MKIGDKVTYVDTGKKGIIKEMREDKVFVVYNCGDDWENYQDYTGAGSKKDELKKGWDFDTMSHLMNYESSKEPSRIIEVVAKLEALQNVGYTHITLEIYEEAGELNSRYHISSALGLIDD